MPETPDQVSSGGPASEHRDLRFAELDAQIQAEEVARQQSRAPAPKRRRHPGPRLSAAVRKEIARFARELRQHRKVFIADPKLKDRASLAEGGPLRERPWRQEPRFFATAQACIPGQGKDSMRVRCTPRGPARVLES
jgi:hypothetical protein